MRFSVEIRDELARVRRQKQEAACGHSQNVWAGLDGEEKALRWVADRLGLDRGDLETPHPRMSEIQQAIRAIESGESTDFRCGLVEGFEIGTDFDDVVKP